MCELLVLMSYCSPFSFGCGLAVHFFVYSSSEGLFSLPCWTPKPQSQGL